MSALFDFLTFYGPEYLEINSWYELIFDEILFQNLRQWKSPTQQIRLTESKTRRHGKTIWTNNQFLRPKNNFKQQKKKYLRKKFRRKMQRHWNTTKTTQLISYLQVNQRIIPPLDSPNCEILCTTKEIALSRERLSAKLMVMTTNN